MIEINPKRISMYRTELMGLSTLFIMFFHSGMEFSSAFMTTIRNIGDIGVEIFLIISGFGIYCSLNKKCDPKQFYYKRFARILPEYLLVNVIWFFVFDCIAEGSIITFLFDLSFLGFWISGKLNAWYIAASLVLYLLSPLYFKVIKKRWSLIWISAPILGGVFIRLTPLNDIVGHLLIFIFRIPAYFVGMKLGEMCIEGKSIRLPWYMIIIPAGAIAVIVVCLGLTSFYLPWAFKYIAYLPIALTFVFISSHILNKNHQVLMLLGECSLEVYLLHEKILYVISYIFTRMFFVGQSQTFAVALIALSISIISAYVLHRGYNNMFVLGRE